MNTMNTTDLQYDILPQTSSVRGNGQRFASQYNDRIEALPNLAPDPQAEDFAGALRQLEIFKALSQSTEAFVHPLQGPTTSNSDLCQESSTVINSRKPLLPLTNRPDAVPSTSKQALEAYAFREATISTTNRPRAVPSNSTQAFEAYASREATTSTASHSTKSSHFVFKKPADPVPSTSKKIDKGSSASSASSHSSKVQLFGDRSDSERSQESKRRRSTDRCHKDTDFSSSKRAPECRRSHSSDPGHKGTNLDCSNRTQESKRRRSTDRCRKDTGSSSSKRVPERRRSHLSDRGHKGTNLDCSNRTQEPKHRRATDRCHKDTGSRSSKRVPERRRSHSCGCSQNVIQKFDILAKNFDILSKSLEAQLAEFREFLTTTRSSNSDNAKLRLELATANLNNIELRSQVNKLQKQIDENNHCRCSLCDISFNHYSSLRRHIQKIH
ncbi:hypothetical protein Bhyg_07665 [Pseudolycoriella hygida]|uniref:C2H2-type domain-containing protein n=1 Tax=Pseudolycoriella hygida TaxID=35572 RepID=A0A9Q0N4E5_9DIPT|nr:hypothetical protein Bhyg_07665 [Pseudolycoriella hygida]